MNKFYAHFKLFLPSLPISFISVVWAGERPQLTYQMGLQNFFFFFFFWPAEESTFCCLQVMSKREDEKKFVIHNSLSRLTHSLWHMCAELCKFWLKTLTEQPQHLPPVIYCKHSVTHLVTAAFPGWTATPCHFEWISRVPRGQTRSWFVVAPISVPMPKDGFRWNRNNY